VMPFCWLEIWETLSRPGGLGQLIETIRNHVFPKALEEGKELFRARQRIGGPLSRQPSESMLRWAVVLLTTCDT